MKKVRIGIIGAGKIAERTHLPQYTASNKAEVVAICDIIKKKATRLAGMFKVPKVYTDYKKMIKEAGIDAVSVCTPNYLHAPMTIYAAKNKKHVLVEKPMSISVKDMKAMIKACRNNKVTLMVEQSHRFDPAHEVLKDYIDRGTIGKILNVRGKLGHAGPEYWSTDSPWFFQKQKSGGGVSVDVGIHILDLIRFVTGKDIIEVSGQTGILDKKVPVEDNIVATIKFKDKTLGVFEASWTTKPYEVVVFLYGTKGKAMVQQAKDRVIISVSNPGNPYAKPKIIKPAIPKKSRHTSPCEYFLSCVINKKKPLIDGVEGMKSMAVILAALESERTKKFVKVRV